MKNMGFGRLILADPIRYDDPGYFETEAGRMAWSAADLLARREIAPNLDSALSGFTHVAGTGADPPRGARVLSPRELAVEVAAVLSTSPSATIALLLGQEDIGLTRDSFSRCNLIGNIPSSDAYASLNLSQAALIFLYEIRMALSPPAPEGRADGGAEIPTRADVQAFYGRLETALDRIGFFQGTGRASMMRDLRAILNRCLLTSRELAIFEGMVHQVLWASRRGD